MADWQSLDDTETVISLPILVLRNYLFISSRQSEWHSFSAWHYGRASKWAFRL